MNLSDRWPLDDLGLRDRLLAAYGATDRGYHDVRHLSEVLTRLDQLGMNGAGFDAQSVQLAAWFHDAVYDGQPRAEERSAAWAEQALQAHGLTDERVHEVSRLIMVTEHHRPRDDDANGCALSDADLAILAAPAARYDEYVADVRREYAAMTDEEFHTGRAAVLRDLLAKPHLFHTSHARDHWEDHARSNVERELRLGRING